MTDANESRLESAEIEALYAAHSRDLLAFLVGVLKDGELAREALQATFAKAIESGHSAERETIRGWLFRVAFNEAIGLRRIQEQHSRLLRRAAWETSRNVATPDDDVYQSELIEEVRRALQELPNEQATVVRMRIYDQQKFIDIAEQLGIPIGTVLSRMRLALEKLEARFESWK